MPYGGPGGYGSGSRYGPGGYDRSQQHNSMNQSRGAPIGGRGAAAPPMPRGGGYGGGGMMEGPPGGMPWVGHGMPPPHGGAGARFCAVKLRGLPFGVKEYEIGMFLVGYVIFPNCVCRVAGGFSCNLGADSRVQVADYW